MYFSKPLNNYNTQQFIYHSSLVLGHRVTIIRVNANRARARTTLNVQRLMVPTAKSSTMASTEDFINIKMVGLLAKGIVHGLISRFLTRMQLESMPRDENAKGAHQSFWDHCGHPSMDINPKKAIYISYMFYIISYNMF